MSIGFYFDVNLLVFMFYVRIAVRMSHENFALKGGEWLIQIFLRILWILVCIAFLWFIARYSKVSRVCWSNKNAWLKNWEFTFLLLKLKFKFKFLPSVRLLHRVTENVKELIVLQWSFHISKTHGECNKLVRFMESLSYGNFFY